MSGGWVPGLDEVPPEVTTAIRDRVLATADELGPEAVLWLAAPPLWTLGIAEAAGFPASPLIDFVRRACDAGWCKARGPLAGDAPPDLVFWMPGEARRVAMDELRHRGGAAWITERLRRAAISVAQVTGGLTVLSAHGPPAAPPWDEVPGALAAWAELMDASSQRYPAVPGSASPGSASPGSASAGAPYQSPRADIQAAADVSRLLFEWTQEAVASGHLGRAQDLVAAGEAIAGVLAGPVEQVLDQARRMVALGLRRRQDERGLGRYLDRPELSGAAARLLDRDGARDGQWALHLRGAGGVGKTMLIRYLASGRYAADRGRPPFPVVRADFDYISPDYPVRRPVQLLLELADELVLHTAVNARADRALAFFRANAVRAHEAASGRREATGSPLASEEVALAVDSFGDVLAQLGDVLLVLDTCEELAKADLGNPASPAVRATLDIIERLHQRAPSARVLFAGRRPLPARPYLTVQEVDGFTQDEARRYLAASRGRPLPPELAEEMIRQSPAVDGLVPAEGELPERVSPFDLALYAAWAEDDPDLDVAEVRRGSDAYVENRIISRLGDPLVVEALPLLAAAGRSRVATLAEVLGCDPDVLGRRLAEQEWIIAGGAPVTDVAARPTVARSLRRYYAADERRAGSASRTAALAGVLLSQLRQAPLAAIDPDELVAALRLLEPAAAAALWDSIADRAIVPPGHWATVADLTSRILFREWDEEEWPTTEALRASVTAAHIAASRRGFDWFDGIGYEAWTAVLASADQHPDPASRRRLLHRAVLGLLPYTPDDDSLWQAVASGLPDRHDAGAEPVADGELAAALADSMDRLLEAGQHQAAERLYRLLPDIDTRLAGPYPCLSAWIEVIRGRLLTDEDPEAARSALERAESLATGGEEEPSWPDWVPPDDLLARVRIEHGLIAPPADLADLDGWESYAAGRLGTADGERLASLCLRIRLRHGVVDAATAGRWESADSYRDDQAPSCTAHDLVPPLFVSVAQAWFSTGDAERARGLLDRRRREALGTRQDQLTVRYADAASIGIVRRLRLTDQASFLARLASTEPDSGDPRPTALGDTRHMAWRALAVVGNETVAFPSPELLNVPEHWHAWWQSRGPANALTDLSNPLARPRWLDARTSADVADIQADLAEIEQLGRLLGGSGFQDIFAKWEALRGGWPESPPPPPPTRSADPHREVRAAMRMAALAGENFEFPLRVPRRLLAEMAFEEAELTALRLPQAATRLFLIATRAYQEADDPLGDYLARLSVLLTRPLPDGSTPARLEEARLLADFALDALTERMPAVASALEARPEDAGPWRHWTPAGREATAWAEAVREAAAVTAAVPDSDHPPAELTFPLEMRPGALIADASSRPETAPDAVAPTRRRGPWFTVASAVLAVLACAAVAVSLALSTATNHSGAQQSAPRSGASPVPWIAALIGGLAALAALLGWYFRKVMRVVRRQGIGASRLGTLMFDAQVSVQVGTGEAGEYRYAVSLEVRARWWRTAPGRARASLWLLLPAVHLAATFRRRTPGHQEQRGYRAASEASGDRLTRPRVRWTVPLPTASAAWWRRGSGAPGIIRGGSAGSYGIGARTDWMAEPWERILAASLSPDAAGRIEWTRLVNVGIGPSPSPQPASMLVGPLAWTRPLSQYYTEASNFSTSVNGPAVGGTLHVIGRAVVTSAGPAMDVTGPYPYFTASDVEATPLDVTELELPQPAMVILQAEPASDDTAGADPPDDQAGKLRLGAALAADGIPAVLLLPVLPATIADELARIITEHARLGLDADARLLLTRVRAAVAPHVAPPVLDDIVLFLNVARYRS